MVNGRSLASSGFWEPWCTIDFFTKMKYLNINTMTERSVINMATQFISFLSTTRISVRVQQANNAVKGGTGR